MVEDGEGEGVRGQYTDQEQVLVVFPSCVILN